MIDTPEPDGVVIGWCRPTYGTPADFWEHLIDVVVFDAVNHRRLLPGRGGLQGVGSGPNVASGRNRLVEQFLEMSTAPWLLQLDADMAPFDRDLVERLLEYADPERAPVVGGLCFTVQDRGVLEPTLYDVRVASDDDGGATTFEHFEEYPPNAMFEVAATGGACLLVHRRVLEAVRDRGFSQAWPWFQETEHAGMRVSEDVTFCIRVRQSGFPIFVNTAVKLGHIKPYAADEPRFLLQRKLMARAEVAE
jgi:hypothetical protein